MEVNKIVSLLLRIKHNNKVRQMFVRCANSKTTVCKVEKVKFMLYVPFTIVLKTFFIIKYYFINELYND